MPPPESKQSLSAWGPSAVPRLSGGGVGGEVWSDGKGAHSCAMGPQHSPAQCFCPDGRKDLAKRLLKPNYSKVRHVVFLYVLTSTHFRHHKNLSLLMAREGTF